MLNKGEVQESHRLQRAAHQQGQCQLPQAYRRVNKVLQQTGLLQP